MTIITTTRQAPPTLWNRLGWRHVLWTVMAAATISVFFYSEVPLLHQARERAHIHALRWLLIPHAIAGTVAFVVGPTQFSNHLRRRFLWLHRVLGRVYVGCVFLAAPLAIASTAFHDYPKAYYFQAAIAVQGGAWLMTTGVAFFAAMQRRIAQHRAWMVRSYAVTFTFVGTRVLQPIPAWNRLGAFRFAAAIVCVTLLATVTPQIARGLSYLAKRYVQVPGRAEA